MRWKKGDAIRARKVSGEICGRHLTGVGKLKLNFDRFSGVETGVFDNSRFGNDVLTDQIDLREEGGAGNIQKKGVDLRRVRVPTVDPKKVGAISFKLVSRKDFDFSDLCRNGGGQDGATIHI